MARGGGFACFLTWNLPLYYGWVVVVWILWMWVISPSRFRAVARCDKAMHREHKACSQLRASVAGE